MPAALYSKQFRSLLDHKTSTHVVHDKYEGITTKPGEKLKIITQEHNNSLRKIRIGGLSLYSCRDHERVNLYSCAHIPVNDVEYQAIIICH